MSKISKTPAQRVREKLKRLDRKIKGAEMRIALLRKKERAEDTSHKFRLGALTDLAGWPKQDVEGTEEKVKTVAAIIQSTDDLTAFDASGDRLFDKHQLEKLKRKKTAFAQGSDWKAETHYRISVGGLFVKYGLGVEKKSLLLGVMAHVQALDHPTIEKNDSGKQQKSVRADTQS